MAKSREFCSNVADCKSAIVGSTPTGASQAKPTFTHCIRGFFRFVSFGHTLHRNAWERMEEQTKRGARVTLRGKTSESFNGLLLLLREQVTIGV
jgi:hypothetical protein